MSSIGKSNERVLNRNAEERRINRFSICKVCGQEQLPICNYCEQVIQNKQVSDEDKCQTCGQELKDDSEDEDISEYQVQTDGTKRLICSGCNRKLKCCPKCDQDYDSDLDDDDDSDTDDADSNNEDSDVSDEESMSEEKHS